MLPKTIMIFWVAVKFRKGGAVGHKLERRQPFIAIALPLSIRASHMWRFCLAGSGSMFQPTSLQALARYLQILSDPRGASDL